MMTEETAKALIATIDRLIILLERATPPGGYGIHIYHYQVEPFRPAQPWASIPSWPPTT